MTRAALLFLLLAPWLGACATARPPSEELVLAQQEIDSGDLLRGTRRMETAYERLGERDPARWDRLGSLADDEDADVAARAFARAEQLRWPNAAPQSVTRLSLPIAGRWRVTQGNRGVYSHARLADRFAWDFQAVDGAGSACRGRSSDPRDFHAFGKPVLAPADGVVARVADGVPDNLDGHRNVVRAAGNVVVIRHARGEFTHFCHLQQGSIAVRAGQPVRRGDVIGRCGASGNALEPHLHFVLRMGPTSDDWSIPAQLLDVRIERRGAPVPGGVPEEDDVVEDVPAR